MKRFDADYGVTIECGKAQNWNLSYLYLLFLKQARRVLNPDGLLLAKIMDMVNNHRSKWPHCDFMQMAADAGFTVYDLIIKIRNGPMRSTKWKKHTSQESITAFGLCAETETVASNASNRRASRNFCRSPDILIAMAC